ncbi:MAG: anti-sigma factor [Bryobacteraceae bacterium]
MTCDELRPEYTAYARGIAGGPESAEITEHIERECANCVPGVASALAAVRAMPGSGKALARAPKRSQVSVYLPWAIIAALSAVLIAVGISVRRQIGDTAKFERALAIVNDPAATDVTFGETEKASKGRVFVSPVKGVVFIGANLPRIDSDKTFELWVTPAKGNPVPAGVFQSQPDATAVFVRPGPVDEAAAITVTVEPDGGSPQPTTSPIVIAKVAKVARVAKAGKI